MVLKKTSNLNIFETYILRQIDHFAEESRRLGTTAPLKEYKKIMDAFITVDKTIGTLQHEVALNTVRGQLKLAMREIRASVIETWRDFWHHRRRAFEFQKEETSNKQETEKHINWMEESLAPNRLIGDPFFKQDELYLAAVRKYAVINLDLSFLSRQASWTQLWVDSKTLSIYFLYMRHRFRMFLFFHAYIFIVPVLLMGFGYSIVSKSIINLLTTYLATLPWIACSLILLPYMLKRYYFDKKLKKLQVRVEMRLIRPLSVRLLIARTLSLQIRTNRQGRE